MRVTGACHRDGVFVILQAVGGFVVDLRAGRLLLHAGFETAALDHEPGDHAVEYRVVIVAVARVLHEVFNRLGRLRIFEFKLDGAVIGGDQYLGHVDSFAGYFFAASTSFALSMVIGALGTF